MKASFLTSLLDAHIAPVLAEHGFGRKKSTWNKRIDGIVHMIDFQVSKGHTPGESEMFTINVGIGVDGVSNSVRGKVPSFYKEWDCIECERIGYLQPAGDRFDKWWHLKNETDIPTVAGDVIHDLRTYALPILNRIQTLHDVKEFVLEVDSHMPKATMSPGVKLGLAALSYIMGEREEYEKLRDDLLAGHPRYGHDMWVDRMTEVAARLEAHDHDCAPSQRRRGTDA